MAAPFGHKMREARWIQLVARAWDPQPPNPFLGGWQPLAPRKNPPGLLSVDSPPAYTWELLTFDPEDRAAYFRAQKWPFQKRIISVDNPPFPEDDKTPLLQQVYRAWDPQSPYPQQQRKVAATILTVATASGAVSSAGVGTDFWVGASLQNTAPKTLLQTHIIRAWDIPATIVQRRVATPQIAATSATGDINSAGVGTDIWVGTATAVAPIAATGTGTASWVGTSAQNTAPRSVIQGQIIAAWAPQQLLLQPRRFLPQTPATPGTGVLSSLGVGLATWIGAETATASFLSTGQATAAFVGRTSAATARRFDGWRPRPEQRRRKDEQEIMAILAAVLPIVQSGTVAQPTRISVPRDGGRTLQ